MDRVKGLPLVLRTITVPRTFEATRTALLQFFAQRIPQGSGEFFKWDTDVLGGSTMIRIYVGDEDSPPPWTVKIELFIRPIDQAHTSIRVGHGDPARQDFVDTVAAILAAYLQADLDAHLPLDEADNGHSTPRQRYNAIIAEAQARAKEKGLSASDEPKDLRGNIEIAEWFLAFWVSRGRTLNDYAKEFTLVGKRTIETYWKEYQALYGIPGLRELDRLRREEDAEDQR